MNYKRAALEQLDQMTGHATNREQSRAIVFAILSLGQADEAEAIVQAAIEFMTTEDGPDRMDAYDNLHNAVRDLIGDFE